MICCIVMFSMKLIFNYSQHVTQTRVAQQQNARHAMMQENVQNAMLNMWQIMELVKVNYMYKLDVH